MISLESKSKSKTKNTSSKTENDLGSFKTKLSGKRILVVDDDDDFIDSIEMNLMELGCVVEKTLDPKSVLDILSKNNFDMIISDVKMPGISGDQLLSLIKKRGITTPILLISGFSEFDRGGALKMGACDYLEKPYKIETLAKTILENLI